MDDLAAYIKQSSNKVIADLKYAIKRKLIPEGHFGTDQMIILMSDDTYAKYQMHQTEFDRYYRKQFLSGTGIRHYERYCCHENDVKTGWFGLISRLGSENIGNLS